nr:SGNH/GDSL hydrolase family protein [uncultured Acetatifactor sp.]
MRYLFQGDSITDCGRGDYENPYATGCGYPRLLEAELMARDGDCEVMNCGISGNRVVDLLARWKKDCLNLKPDVITILIGVNDVWHELGNRNGVSAPLFEEVYRILLRETFAALPGVRMVLMGAYVIPGLATDPEWERFSGEVKARRDVTRRLAEEFRLDYVDLQEAFDEAQKKFPAARWSGDGVHPTAAGHELIAQAWKKAMGI